MRTLDELERYAEDATICSYAAYDVDEHGNIEDELRHLIAIARAADALCLAWEQPSLDGFLKAVREARKAGLFGGDQLSQENIEKLLNEEEFGGEAGR